MCIQGGGGGSWVERETRGRGGDERDGERRAMNQSRRIGTAIVCACKCACVCGWMHGSKAEEGSKGRGTKAETGRILHDVVSDNHTNAVFAFAFVPLLRARGGSFKSQVSPCPLPALETNTPLSPCLCVERPFLPCPPLLPFSLGRPSGAAARVPGLGERPRHVSVVGLFVRCVRGGWDKRRVRREKPGDWFPGPIPNQLASSRIGTAVGGRETDRQTRDCLRLLACA